MLCRIIAALVDTEDLICRPQCVIVLSQAQVDAHDSCQCICLPELLVDVLERHHRLLCHLQRLLLLLHRKVHSSYRVEGGSLASLAAGLGKGCHSLLGHLERLLELAELLVHLGECMQNCRLLLRVAPLAQDLLSFLSDLLGIKELTQAEVHLRNDKECPELAHVVLFLAGPAEHLSGNLHCPIILLARDVAQALLDPSGSVIGGLVKFQGHDDAEAI
mmetsp:Transcript_39179/g.88258  ORF Transcript_39179/g.88258 Transcript_39179/m.88258 type:complete len:218 (-) Transcript_39179:67-720(-)